MRHMKSRNCLAAIACLALLTAGCGDDNEGATATPQTLGETIAINSHFGAGTPVDRAELAKLRAAGTRILRNDINWASVERQRGVYDFTTTHFDDLVHAASDAGLRILFILDYGNRLYGPANAVVDEAGRAAFAAFAAAAAQRYRGHGCAWEVWNEPNLGSFWNGGGARPNPEVYGLLVKAAAAAIRTADPSATILMGAAYTGFPELVPLIGGIPGVEFLDRLFATGALSVVDAVTFHPYRAEPPETVGATVDAIRRSMAAAGRSLPLWCGEWGYTTYDPDAPATNVNTLPASSLDQQASYAARMLLNNFRLDLPTTVWYQDHDPADPAPGDMEAHFGLLNFDLSPKPAYTAVDTVNRLLGDGRLADELSLGAGRYGLQFDTPRGPVTALWAEAAVTWSIELGSAETRLVGRSGQALTPAVAGNALRLSVEPDDGPIYAVGALRTVAAE